MDNNKTTVGQAFPAPTGVFEANRPQQTNTGMFPVEGSGHKAVSEKTLRKRLARLASSRPVLALCILLSVSTFLTAFRGYFLPVTLLLTLGRGLFAAAAWMIYLTAGKKGSGFLAALPLYATASICVVLLFFAVFIFSGMFGKMVLVSGDSAEELVRLIYSAKLWAIVPALAFVTAAYCLYLFARHQRLLFCNIRDGLIYGFPFENGYGGFVRACITVAVALPCVHIVSGIIGTFGSYEVLSSGAAELFDRIFLSDSGYWLNLLGVLVHSSALITAAVVAMRYGTVVKKYKEQRELYKAAKKAKGNEHTASFTKTEV